MRKFKNLSKQRQTQLSAQFPDLYKLASIEDTPHYHYLAVSVFDHWLSREESFSLLVNVPAEEQNQRNTALYSFSQKLAAETEIINFKFCGKWNSCRPAFRELTSTKAKNDYLEPALSASRNDFFKIVLPELDAVFMESWDDTNIFYLRNTAHIETLKRWAQECGVFCLNKWR